MNGCIGISSIKIRRILDIFKRQSVIIDSIKNDLKSMKITALQSIYKLFVVKKSKV